MKTATTRATGNADDRAYRQWQHRMQAEFERNIYQVGTERRAIFTTDVDGSVLWGAYLAGMRKDRRQYHNCNTCRHFVERYGNLVVMTADGATEPLFWNADACPPEYVGSMDRIISHVMAASVSGVFYSSAAQWGEKRTGIWDHMALTPPDEMVYVHATVSASQKSAAKLQDFETVKRALREWSTANMAQAVTLLQSGTLASAEKVLGAAIWLNLVKQEHNTARGKLKDHVIWNAIAQAPAGFCHPRSGMLGTLLDDLTAGKSVAAIVRAFGAKVAPDKYMRPVAAPAAGTISRAESIVMLHGWERSFERRFARLEELQKIWQPNGARRDGSMAGPSNELSNATGVFAAVKPKHVAAAPQIVDLSHGVMTLTWEKFARTVLPLAVSCEVHAPLNGNYCAYLTAFYTDAPPIHQWDFDGLRNPFSLYVYTKGSSASRWKVAHGWNKVNAFSKRPHAWHSNDFKHMSGGVLVVIDGARDTYTDAGNALFPSDLRSELHEVRSVIEKFSKDAQIHGRDDASACGLLFEGKEPIKLRIVNAQGHRLTYTIDRLD